MPWLFLKRTKSQKKTRDRLVLPLKKNNNERIYKSVFCIDYDFAERIIKCIDNVSFTNPMDSHLSKLSYEYQALAILKLVLGEKAKGFVKSETPDLQNARTKVGVEVVTSHPATYRKAENEERKLFTALKNKDSNAVTKVKKHIQEEGLLLSEGNSIFYPINPDIETYSFINALLLKTKKIKNYKAKGFEKIGLFVWHLSPVTTSVFEDVANEWEEILRDVGMFQEHRFDFLIVVVNYTLLFFNDTYICEQQIEIPFSLFSKLPFFGRMAAEGLLPDNDLFWV